MATKSSIEHIVKARKLLQALRNGFPGDPPSIQLLHTFLVVAENEGKTVGELADLVGAGRTTISRHLLDLSEHLRTGEPGYGMLNRLRNPTDLRSVVFTVTSRGRVLLNSIKDVLE